MKKTIALLTAAALAPMSLFAQSPAPAPAAEEKPAPAPFRLPQVQFDEATLAEIVEFLQMKTKEAGIDAIPGSLNVVISPGLQNLRVPALSLRNVSPTEVMTVATTVLGLQMEPVAGDEGQVAAYIISKAAGGAGGPVASDPSLTAPQFIGSPEATTPPPATQYSPPANVFIPQRASVPYTVEVAASLPRTAGFSSPMSAQPAARVFGVASLIASGNSDPKVQQHERLEKLERLIDSLKRMAGDQGGRAEVNAYAEMDIIIVKSADQALVTLIAEAIEAMKSNAAKADTGRAEADALRAEMNALKAQLDIAVAEREMTRRTAADQLELLKAAQKADDASRTKR